MSYEQSPEQELEKKRQAFKLATELAGFAWNDFAKSLVEFYNERGFLSPKQLEAGRNLLRKARESGWNESSPPLAVVSFQEEQSKPPIEEEPF